MAKIGIGTAGWGKPYGNDLPPSKVEITKILRTARRRGIEIIDTAPAYEVDTDFSGFKVVQKTPYQGDCYALLQHDPDGELPREGNYKRGISVYTPEQLERVIDDIDIVQLPLSIADNRFLPFLPILRNKGVEIHARSVFMRGMLLDRLDVKTCLGYVLAQDVDYVVVGINSDEQMKEVCEVVPLDVEPITIDERLLDLRGASDDIGNNSGQNDKPKTTGEVIEAHCGQANVTVGS